MITTGLKKELGKKKIGLLKKLFKKRTNTWREKASENRIDEVRKEMMEECLNGLNQADEIISGSTGFNFNENVEELFSKIEIEKVEHQETRNFIDRLKQINEKNELLDFIDDFEKYYLNRINEVVD